MHALRRDGLAALSAAVAALLLGLTPAAAQNPGQNSGQNSGPNAGQAAAAPASAIARPAAKTIGVPSQRQYSTALIVINAQGARLEGGKDGQKLVLEGVMPSATLFTSRPVRTVGHMVTPDMVALWRTGSFAKDPPNATLSVFEKGKDELSDVVVTLRNPRVSGSDLTYDVTVISGTLPKPGMGPASLFIDIIGLPFTPLSFAGVARRTAYRTVVWGGAAAAASAAAASAYYHPPAPFYSAPVPATYPVPVPTVHVTETVQAPPAPAPAVSSGQAAAVAKLKELKSLQSQGLISEAQYQAESQKLLNQIVQ